MGKIHESNGIQLGVKNWRFKEKAGELLVAFLVNPFLALPFSLIGIYNRHRYALTFLALIVGVLSFLYVPSISNDKARFVYYHMLFEKDSFTFNSFFEYIKDGRPDFLLLFLIFVFAKLGIAFPFVAFIATFITVLIFFSLFHKIAVGAQLSKASYFQGFLLVLFCLSLQTLFSGIRFYLAFSIALLAFWHGLKHKQHLIAAFFLTVATSIHFSSSLYIPVYIFLHLFWSKNYFITISFFLSFAFVLLPKEVLYATLSALGLPASYQAKADIYMAGEDVLVSKREGSQSGLALIINFIKSLWIVVGVAFVISRFRRVSQLKSLTLVFWSIGNLVFSVPTVYGRLMVIPKLLISLWIIQDLGFKGNKIWLYLILTFWLISFLSEVLIMRNNILPSYLTPYSLNLLFMVFRDLSPQDFIR